MVYELDEKSVRRIQKTVSDYKALHVFLSQNIQLIY